MVPNDLNTVMKIRDITAEDINEVYQFLVKEQGDAEHENDRGYIEALINGGELKVDGKISYPRYEERTSSPPKTDFLRWIVDSDGYHFGKIACLDNKIIGVLLCYTKSRGRNIAFLSNIAVASQHRRRGVGSALIRKLIDFYRPQREIEAIELNVGITNAVAIKFHLENGFRIKEIRDYSGYTMEYRLRPGC